MLFDARSLAEIILCSASKYNSIFEALTWYQNIFKVIKSNVDSSKSFGKFSETLWGAFVSGVYNFWSIKPKINYDFVFYFSIK